jgi:hypothetical protein
MRFAVLALGVVLSGCVTHRATVAPATPVADGQAAGAQVLAGSATPSESSPLPCALPVSAWRQDDDGTLYRWDALVLTPTPWWQRFPCDALSDGLVPGTRLIATTATPTWRKVGGGTSNTEQLTAHARAAGYAAPDETSP